MVLIETLATTLSLDSILYLKFAMAMSYRNSIDLDISDGSIHTYNDKRWAEKPRMAPYANYCECIEVGSHNPLEKFSYENGDISSNSEYWSCANTCLFAASHDAQWRRLFI